MLRCVCSLPLMCMIVVCRRVCCRCCWPWLLVGWRLVLFAFRCVICIVCSWLLFVVRGVKFDVSVFV